ncbi:MAG: hypothetical protein LBM92_06515, partial [Opitutaceae bacterium]|nr:hypothetical protein [Opitutaceae bacterium]
RSAESFLFMGVNFDMGMKRCARARRKSTRDAPVTNHFCPASGRGKSLSGFQSGAAARPV